MLRRPAAENWGTLQTEGAKLTLRSPTADTWLSLQPDIHFKNKSMVCVVPLCMLW